MYKRTLYVSYETQQQIDLLAHEHQRSKAEILRLAVELGLKVINDKYHPKAEHTTPTPSAENAYPPNQPHVITSPNSNIPDDFLTRLLKLILK